MSGRFPKISVVTPNYNQEKFLEQSILSVLDQDYPDLELIVIDGGSTDGSVEIIKKHESRISYWVSEKDKGMYDAINKGFARSTGEIMCWLNSDDILMEGTLEYIAKVFAEHPEVEWLQGRPTVIDKEGKIIYQRDPVYSKFYFYLFNHERTFAFIQQESTFWKRSLWARAGGRISMEYKLASDFDLWMRFFEKGRLYCVERSLSAFRKREGQLSGNQELYLKEAQKSVNDHFRRLSLFEKMIVKTGRKLNALQYRAGGKLKPLIQPLLSLMIGKLRYIKG